MHCYGDVAPGCAKHKNMSDATIRQRLSVSARVFPEAEDMARWNALSPAEQMAEIEREEEEGFKSGDAAAESLDDRLARVRRP